MPVQFNGKLIHAATNQFKGETGEDVSYHIYTLAADNGLLTINSKRDFSDKLDIPATITLRLSVDKSSNKLYKVSLTEISPLQVDSGYEKTVR